MATKTKTPKKTKAVKKVNDTKIVTSPPEDQDVSIQQRILNKIKKSLAESKKVKTENGRIILSAEQEKKLNEVYLPKWQKISVCTDETNLEEAKRGAILCYRALGLKEPTEFYLVNNPREGLIKAKEIMKKYNPTQEFTNSELFFSQSYAYSDSAWLVFYDFFKHETDVDVSDTEGLIVLAQNSGWWIGMEGEGDEPSICIFQHRPKTLAVRFPRNPNDRAVLHNENGPAVSFRVKEGEEPWDVYKINDIEVDKSIIDRTFTAADIDKQNNAEIKRLMVERFGNGDLSGPARYIKESKMTPIASDDWGSIFRKDQGQDEPIWVIKLINSTPEPDGTYKDYWMTFDPNAYNGMAAKVPQAAVASMWRDQTDKSLIFQDYRDYHPFAES